MRQRIVSLGRDVLIVVLLVVMLVVHLFSGEGGHDLEGQDGY